MTVRLRRTELFFPRVFLLKKEKRARKRKYFDEFIEKIIKVLRYKD
jgi:hypothetical protein